MAESSYLVPRITSIIEVKARSRRLISNKPNFSPLIKYESTATKIDYVLAAIPTTATLKY